MWLSKHKVAPDSGQSNRTALQPFLLDLRLSRSDSSSGNSSNSSSQSTGKPTGPLYLIVNNNRVQERHSPNASPETLDTNIHDQYETSDESAEDPATPFPPDIREPTNLGSAGRIVFFSAEKKDIDFMRDILQIRVKESSSSALDSNYSGGAKSTDVPDVSPTETTPPVSLTATTILATPLETTTLLLPNRITEAPISLHETDEVIKLEVDVGHTSLNFYETTTEPKNITERTESTTDFSTDASDAPVLPTSSAPGKPEDTTLSFLPGIPTVTPVPTDTEFEEKPPASEKPHRNLGEVSSTRGGTLLDTTRSPSLAHQNEVPRNENASSYSETLHGFRGSANSSQSSSLGDRIVTVTEAEPHLDKINAKQSNLMHDKTLLVKHGEPKSHVNASIADKSGIPARVRGESATRDNNPTQAPTSTELPAQDISKIPDLVVPATTLAPVRIPTSRLKPVFLAADVKSVLDEVNRESSAKSRKNGAAKILTPRPRHESEKRWKIQAEPVQTTISPEFKESSESEGIDDSQGDDSDERIEYDEETEPRSGKANHGRTFVKVHSGESYKGVSAGGKAKVTKGGRKDLGEKNSNRKTRKPEAPSVESTDDNEDEEIAEVFKTLRENDHNSCIQRAICEYEALKRTTKLTRMQESFVDLFG